MIRITTVAVLGCMTGCATVASGPYGVSVDEGNRAITPPSVSATTGLKISAGELDVLSSPYFGAVEVTFENPTPAWIQIDSVDIDFGSPQRNQNVLIPWGSDIEAWRVAVLDTLAVERANGQQPLQSAKALQMLAVGADGMSVRYWPRGSTVRNGGVVALDAVGTLRAPLSGQPSAGATPADQAEPFPPNHLLTFPIRVPPGLFAKRWVLLYTSDSPPGGCMRTMVLGYTTSDKKHERIALPFKAKASAWQFAACGGSGFENGVAPVF